MKYILTAIFILTATSSFAQTKTFKEFYPSGKLKKISHEGAFNGCHMKVGTDSVFYENGQLMTTIHYDNRGDKNDPGCHATWTTETTTYYYPTGKCDQPCSQSMLIKDNPAIAVTRSVMMKKERSYKKRKKRIVITNGLAINKLCVYLYSADSEKSIKILWQISGTG